MLHVKNGTLEQRLPCTVKVDSAKYAWYKDGILIKNKKDKYVIKNKKYLKVKDVRVSDKGFYVCNASNSQGQVNKTFYLDVATGW